MLLVGVFRHIIYVKLMHLSINLRKWNILEDSIYFIHFVHLLEGKISQISIICDEEGKMLNLPKLIRLWALILSLFFLVIIQSFLAASTSHVMKRKSSVKHFRKPVRDFFPLEAFTGMFSFSLWDFIFVSHQGAWVIIV